MQSFMCRLAFLSSFFFYACCQMPALGQDNGQLQGVSKFPELIGQSPGYQTVPFIVPQPLSPSSQAAGSSLLQPDTVLEALPGTGLESTIGVSPGKVTHKLDKETMDQLRDILSRKQPPQQVDINPALSQETLERLTRLSLLLEAVLWLAGGGLGASLLGRFGPLVARLAAGLLYALRAGLPEPTRTQEATSSTPTSSLNMGNQAAPLSTMKPAG